MRTTKHVADEPTTKNQSRHNKSSARRRVLALTIAASGMVGMASLAAVAFAERPEPINRLGRVGGCGWSDGYHACQSSGTRPLADLPPVSYTSRYDVARFTIAGHAQQQQSTGGSTYYDHFDRACRNAECDSVNPVRFDEGCDTAGDQGCDAAFDPYNQGIFGMRRSQKRSHYDPAAEQRLREQEELNRQRAILAEEERQREYRVFEKYRLRTVEQEAADDEGTMSLPSPSPLPEPIKGPTPTDAQRTKSGAAREAKPKSEPKSTTPDRKPGAAPKNQRSSADNWLPQRIPPDTAIESPKAPSQPAAKPGTGPTNEDLRQDSPSDLPIDATSHLPGSQAKIVQTQRTMLAQSQIDRPRPIPTRLPSADPVRDSAKPSVMESPKEPRLPAMLPPIQAPISKPTDEAQTEPAKRVAAADWLIIRQPK